MTPSKSFPTTTSCGPFIYPPGGTLRGRKPPCSGTILAVILPQQIRAILRNRPTANNSLTKLYICSLLLLNACDTETNPGPGADHSTVYPCGACDMPVTWAQQAVACETCSVWYHIDCQGISSQTYDARHQQLRGTATHVVSPTIRQHYLT